MESDVAAPKSYVDPGKSDVALGKSDVAPGKSDVEPGKMTWHATSGTFWGVLGSNDVAVRHHVRHQRVLLDVFSG